MLFRSLAYSWQTTLLPRSRASIVSRSGMRSPHACPALSPALSSQASFGLRASGASVCFRVAPLIRLPFRRLPPFPSRGNPRRSSDLFCHRCFNENRAASPRRFRVARSNYNPLDLVERDLIASTIIKPRGARRLMRGHLLRDFELPAIFQIRGNSRRTERVVADLRRDAGARSAAPDHEIRLRLAHAPAGELPSPALRRLEEGSLLAGTDPGGFDVGREVFLQVVVRRHLVALAALLMQAHPPAPALRIIIFHVHADRGAHARERVDHEGDQRAIPEADNRGRVHAVQELPRLVGRQDRRLALLGAEPRPTHR